MKRKLLTLIQLVLIGIMAFSAYQIGTYFFASRQRAQSYAQIEKQVDEYRKQTDGGQDSSPQSGQDLIQMLRLESPDTVAYIEIPAIGLAYPVVQTTDNDFYLDHASDRSKNIGGAIFLDHMNKADFSDANSILYGHQMKDGSMFKQLHAFRKAEAFEGDLTIYLTQGQGRHRYRIFAAMPVMSDEDYRLMHFESPQSKEAFLSYIKEQSDQYIAPPEDSDHFLTLSTCAYERRADRLAVYAYLENDQ